MIEKKEEDTTDVKLEEYGLDLRYRAGKHLIYDCDRGFYVCVDDVSRDNCNFRREKQEMHKNNSLSCAFFKTYPDKKTCVLEQYKMMEKKLKPVFCFRKHL